MVKTTISSYHSKMVETTKKQIAISDSLCYHFFVVVITIHFLECTISEFNLTFNIV